MLPPLPRRSDWVPLLLNPPVVSTFPERVIGSVCASTFSRLAQRSLTLRPAHSPCHQFVTCISRRLQPFRYLHSCSASFRLEHLPGGTCTHWKTPPFHGAHPFLPVAKRKLSDDTSGRLLVNEFSRRSHRSPIALSDKSHVA